MLLILLGQSFSDCFHILSFLETFVYSHGFLIYSYRIFGDRLLRQTEEVVGQLYRVIPTVIYRTGSRLLTLLIRHIAIEQLSPVSIQLTFE